MQGSRGSCGTSTLRSGSTAAAEDGSSRLSDAPTDSSSGVSPARPERRFPKAFGRRPAWLAMPRIARATRSWPKTLGNRLYGSLSALLGITSRPVPRTASAAGARWGRPDRLPEDRLPARRRRGRRGHVRGHRRRHRSPQRRRSGGDRDLPVEPFADSATVTRSDPDSSWIFASRSFCKALIFLMNYKNLFEAYSGHHPEIPPGLKTRIAVAVPIALHDRSY